MGNGRPGGADDAFVGQVGIINWDGSSEVRLRASRSTAGSVIRTLPFNTRLQVISRFTDGWSLVATPDGGMGFVASSYIWTNLPEPNARLHRVEKDIPGTAIAICETYYADQIQWGQDLRFYVNVLGLVNHKTIPPGTFHPTLRGLRESCPLIAEVSEKGSPSPSQEGVRRDSPQSGRDGGHLDWSRRRSYSARSPHRWRGWVRRWWCDRGSWCGDRRGDRV